MRFDPIYCPECGDPAVGQIDLLAGLARFTAPDEDNNVEWGGETEIFWDSAVPLREDDCLDENTVTLSCRTHEWQARELDDCSQCGGASGGVPGNENVVNGALLCDYCHVGEIKESKTACFPPPSVVIDGLEPVKLGDPIFGDSWDPWSPSNSAQAIKQGWNIFSTDGAIGHAPFELQADHDSGIFIEGDVARDDKAAAYVLDRADLGDWLAVKALDFLRKYSPEEYERIKNLKPVLTVDPTTQVDASSIAGGASDTHDFAKEMKARMGGNYVPPETPRAPGQKYGMGSDRHGRWIVHYACGTTSYHEDDVRERYCGKCREHLGVTQ